LIPAEGLERIARLFSRNFCASGIAGKALDHSQLQVIKALVELRTKLELSGSGLQQSNGLTKVSFKSQFGDFDSAGTGRSSVRVYSCKQFPGLFQVTLSLVNPGFCRDQVRIVWFDLQRSVVHFHRCGELSKH
jgi:hypothetical protein